MKKGELSIWMIVVGGVIALVVVVVMGGIIVGGMNDGGDFVKGKISDAEIDKDCDGVPDYMDDNVGDSSNCPSEQN